MLATPPARAGSYSGPVYSGGTYHGRGPNGVEGDYNDTLSTSGWGGSGNSVASASAAGTINATFTWQTTQNEPPPPSGSVIITETSTASAAVRTPPNGSCQATCDDGFGLPGSKQTQAGAAQYSAPPNPVLTGYVASASAKDTRYSTNGGATISLSVSPSATAGISSSYNTNASVSYTASVSPVTISLTGTTQDSSGDLNILVGQKCIAGIDGIPTGTGWTTTYAWSVSGTTLQSWTVSSDQKTTTEVDGSGPLNVASPAWYWNDNLGTGNSKQETVACTATVTPPGGQGAPFTVTASQNVRVYVPDWTAIGTGGYVKVNIFVSGNNYSQYEIYAGATVPMEQANANNLNGMNFNVTLTSPAPALFADGNLELVQLVTPREAATNYNGVGTDVRFFPDYGEEGLDSVYPYGWSKASLPPAPIIFYTGDSPGFDLVDHTTYSATLKHDFKDFLLYLAPGSQQPVPVARFIWSDDGNAQIPSTGLWSDYAKEHGGSDSVGTVTPSGNDATFLTSNQFPSWTQID